MERTCAQALELGLPSVAFTEHADFTAWAIPENAGLPAHWAPFVADAVLAPPPLDVDGYRECLERCRGRYPGLRILSGVELGEPHWHPASIGALLDLGGFDRVLASVHSAPLVAGTGFTGVEARYVDHAPDQVVRDYLAEVARLVEGFDGFEILAHIDYPVRHWPSAASPHDPGEFEDDYRRVLRALSDAGKTPEVNTRVPLHLQVVRWWHDEGGQAITFASDAHHPAALARGFADATQLARAAGFRPSLDPYDFWRRA
jgi:histidinol-phosphatase (PHP family)